MEPNQTLGRFSARSLEAVDAFLARHKPALVLVQGDTTTVFMATLAAFYHRIPVGHVEAGLRTGDLQSPWPEEANRVLTTRLATLHFAPTTTSRSNLLREGVAADRIVVTGNTVIDALFLALAMVKKEPPAIPGVAAATLAAWEESPLVLITGHRRENHGPGFEAICRAIAELARRFPQTHFVYPVHLNPHVREPVQRILGSAVGHNIHLLEPLPYLPFVALLARAKLVLTDSGGIQEEAPSLGKPVLVMRDTTERPEAVEAGTVKLVGTDYEVIVRQTSLLLTDPAAFAAMARAHNPYGDGQATGRIVAACVAHFARGAVRKEPGMRFFSRDVLLVAVLTLLALALRLAGNDRESIWFDEAVSLLLATTAEPIDLSVWRRHDVGNPAGYFLLLRAWFDFWGDAGLETARSLSAVAGALSVPAVWLLARALGTSRRAGQIACFLVAVSPPLVYLGQEARVFALFATVATLTAAAAAWIRRTDRPAAWLAFALGGAVLVHLHYYAGFVLTALGLALLFWAWPRPRALARLLGATVFIALVFLPWLPSFRWQMSRGATRTAESAWHHLALLPSASLVGQTLVWKEDGLPAVAAVGLCALLVVYVPVLWLLFRAGPGPLSCSPWVPACPCWWRPWPWRACP